MRRGRRRLDGDSKRLLTAYLLLVIGIYCIQMSPLFVESFIVLVVGAFLVAFAATLFGLSAYFILR